jgi:NTE family protein
LNEITFNASLLKELRAIAFATKLIEQDWLKDEHRDKLKHVLVHSIRADEFMCDLTVASKFRTDWGFLCRLRDLGREAAARWLERTYEHIGHHSTVDLRSEYLGAPAVHKEHAHA